jgi:hypothetical protein
MQKEELTGENGEDGEGELSFYGWQLTPQAEPRGAAALPPVDCWTIAFWMR